MIDSDDIWDEFQWEEFMREQDKKVDRYMELLYRYQSHPNREEIIAREMGLRWFDQSEPMMDVPESTEENDDREGEEWKISSGVEGFEREAFFHQPVCLKAKEFALRVSRFVDDLSEPKREDSAVVDFVANAMIASAKIAGGTGMGEGVDELGANIAYCKRGLAAANLTIAALHEMREKNIVVPAVYAELVREATDVRNTIALHILDLREKFYHRIP